ncbi:hypothetical protein BJV85_001375 [Clostridium acetobutylicum]|uniref:Predicted membrane protein n=1 Tax=Clostridium acetobutylicum (strain ATCC 824 / DSM 792 / JCM 1419 / IAM 19013 / LMG 5710 / NBRC 13948 / NRRL B-527 / VKM B-1787 / 2291 / W) TaxID=272562 RepID=Q97G58_CLOAB|nr:MULTISPECIES: hypothetical protein [Clostridium]AAK80465.1 Predicted membrane protein [Clostridium acetobutylicum ATCC 824]ADZ21562.1 membrane protein [Clostridium acetobutylicum EA 2018]AEI32400.1 hypothetical protein SMB_G2546 [Clostridium acetobutylicum DSM 1731]AWV79118.1 hypothetical protein DK921_03195 [Clostridium acetobutylicum]MBC2394920.1 hypothetical protein [Clostridium acetobutylicum]
MFKKIINLISIIIITAYIFVTIYAFYCNVPFKEDFIGYSFVLIMYIVLFYMGKYSIVEALKLKKTPKNRRRSKYGVKTNFIVGIFSLTVGVMFGMASIMNIYDIRADVSEYSSGNIISDSIKVNNVILGNAHSGKGTNRTTTKIINEIDGTSIKSNKKLEFKNCSFYVSQILKGHVYKVKYLPTTHRILAIQSK